MGTYCQKEPRPFGQLGITSRARMIYLHPQTTMSTVDGFPVVAESL